MLKRLFFLLWLSSAINVSAQTNFYWTNSTSSAWSNTGNWTNGVPASGGDTNYILNFVATGAYTASNDFPGTFTLNGLNFLAGTVTLDGAPLLFVSNGTTLPAITNSSGAVAYIRNDLILGTNTIFSTPNSMTISGTVSGTGALVKIGANTLTLTTANTYSGGTFINTGVVTIANGNALGTGAASVANGAQLQLTGGITVTNALTLAGQFGTSGALQGANGSNVVTGPITLASDIRLSVSVNGATLAISGPMSGSGGFAIRNPDGGTGVILLLTNNTYAGATTVIIGTLQLGVTNALPTGTVLSFGANSAAAGRFALTDVLGNNQQWAGLATVSGNLVPSTLTNSLPTLATLTINQTANTTYNGAIGGNISLVKQGTGTLALTGTNTYTDVTLINAGVLVAGHSNAIGATTGATTVNSGGILTLGSNVTITGETLTLFGTGGDNYGALQASANSTGTWNGPVIIGSNAGTLAPRLGGQAGGVLLINGPITNGGGSDLYISARNIVILAATNNAYTGLTGIVRGTLKLGADNALPTGTILDVDAAATGAVSEDSFFDLGGFNQTVARLQRSGEAFGTGGSVITNTGLLATLTVNQSANTTFSGNIGGALSLVKNGTGTLALSGTNTYTGPTVLNDGVLQFNSTVALPTSATNLFVPAGAALAAGYAMDQAFLARVSTGSVGVVALATNSANNLDFNAATGANLANVSLGAVSGVWSYTGNLTPFGSTYRLGGGGGTLLLPNNGALTGANNLQISGSGVVWLSGTNDFNGGITITVGSLLFADDTALGAIPGSFAPSNIVVNGGTLGASGNDVTLHNNRGIAVGSNGLAFATTNILRYAGVISDLTGQSGVVTIASSGVAVALSGANTYSGGTLLNGGTLAIAGVRALGTGLVSFNGGNIRTLSGNTATVSNSVLFAANTTVAPGGNTLTFVGAWTLTNGTRTLTVEALTVLNGAIGDNGNGYGLTKAGANTLILNGANIYTGPTTIAGGTLTLGASAIMTNTVRFELYSNTFLNVTAAGLPLLGQELKGSGTVLGNVIMNGGTLSPGNSVGTLTVGNLTLANGVQLAFELGAPGASDLVIVTNALSFTGMETNWFVLSTVSGFGVGEYTLFDAAAGTMSLGSGTNFTNIGGSGLDGYLWLDDVNKDVKLTVVPEPHAGALVGIGLLALLAFRRWRQSLR